jgi:alanine dehydrogenase
MIKIGVPKEVKNNERRVGLRPGDIKELLAWASNGPEKLEFLVEAEAGVGSGYYNQDYKDAGASIASSAAAAYKADLVMKVKEPQKSEWGLLNGQMIFGYLHASTSEELLNNKGTTLFAPYELISNGSSLPCLTPMSAIAGRLAVQKGAQCLEGEGGRLLGGIPGTAPCKVVIIGGGIVGTNAMKIALGMGADVTILDIDQYRLIEISSKNPGVKTIKSTPSNISRELKDADLVIGAVLIPGKAAPKVITTEDVKSMKNDSCIVDVSIDEGGCCETSEPTSHSNPTYKRHGVTHYCVTNIPALVPQTATTALCQETVPYLKKLINSFNNGKFETVSGITIL